MSRFYTFISCCTNISLPVYVEIPMLSIIIFVCVWFFVVVYAQLLKGRGNSAATAI